MPVFVLVGYAACDEYPYVGATLDIVWATDGGKGLVETDDHLRNKAAVVLYQKGCKSEPRLTNVLQREVSREKLLELAKSARTKEEIVASQVEVSDI